MKKWIGWLAIILLSVAPIVAGAPATQPASTQPESESTPVEKDGVAVSVVSKKSSFAADNQPELFVRFKNVTNDYKNLYDVGAYWNWTIQFTDRDAHPPTTARWQLNMHSIPMRAHLEFRQIKPGESTDIPIDLNDPPFTFNYSQTTSTTQGTNTPTTLTTRFLKPGHYQLSAVVALPKFPMGNDPHFFLGPVTTGPLDLTVTQSLPTTQSKEEIAACDAAIARVTDKLESNGMWTNGGSPAINLPKDAKIEDVVDSAVNQTILDSKDYRVLRTQPFVRDKMPRTVSGGAVLVRVGKALKVVVVYPDGPANWWSRFYDTELVLPDTRPVAGL